MDFNSKNYQIFKVKKYLKKSSFFFLYHVPKLKNSQWLFVEQNLKKLMLGYYKVANSSGKVVVKNSIYSNFSNLICGIVLFVKPSQKYEVLDNVSLLKSLKHSFIKISLKLNNRIYSNSQVRNLKSFSYKQSIFDLNCSLEKYSKISYTLTAKKSE
jgi:hypothetical protein